MVLLWCLIGRVLSLEVRARLDDPVWRIACDVLFPPASFVALARGAAAGSMICEVPPDAWGRMSSPDPRALSVEGKAGSAYPCGKHGTLATSRKGEGL